MTDLHIHTFSYRFLEVPQNRSLKYNLLAFFKTKVGGLIISTKTQFKNLIFCMVVNWQKYFL